MAKKIQMTFDCGKAVDDLALELTLCASAVFKECSGEDKEAWRVAMISLVSKLNRHAWANRMTSGPEPLTPHSNSGS